MKTCIKCHQEKELVEFNKRKDAKDGYRNDCKNCRTKCQKVYRQTDQGKTAQKRFNQSKNGIIVHRSNANIYRTRHPKQIIAHHAVNNLVRAGRLPRPDTLQCSYGNHQAEQYHHWHGYEPEHWLDVIPICIECHSKLKRRIA